MKLKFSKVLCMLLVVAAVFCLHTAVFAEETTYLNQILGPMGASDLDGNLILNTDGGQMILRADFGDNSLDTLAWEVLEGKDVVSIHKRDGYPAQAVLTGLSDGEATVIAYLEDGSQVSATCKVIVSQQTADAAGVVTLSTSVEGDGTVSRIVDASTTVNLGSSYTNQFAAGTEIELKAVENQHPFKYWVVRHGSDKDTIVSTEETYKFILGTNVTVVAIFDKTGDFYGTGVEFVGNNLISLNKYIKSLALSTIPTAPYQRNMTFSKWESEQASVDTVLADGKIEKSELTGTTTFTATYTKKDVECDITVIGGSGSGTYAYGAPVTVSLTAAAEAGKQFLFWSKDGAPVSYETEYKFSAVQDCTVSAVFGEATEGDGIAMVMQTPVEDGNAIAFTFERYVPDTYTFVSSGFVVSKISNCVLGDSGNNLMEAVSYRDGSRTQYTKSLTKVSGVSTYYARGYVIYKDGDTVKTIYTKPQAITVE